MNPLTLQLLSRLSFMRRTGPWGFALASMLALIGTCHTENAPRGVLVDLLAIDVSASQSLNPESFNKQLMTAHAEGQLWAHDPVQIVSKFINPELARNAIWAISGSGERPSRYRVAVVIDGIPDDSVRGRRYEATIERDQNGVWQIRDASSSWRCWRARTSVFGVEPCP